MEIVVLTVLFVGAIMAAMAVGVVFGRPCLRGSCGGPEVTDADGEPLSCAACPRRKLADAARRAREDEERPVAA